MLIAMVLKRSMRKMLLGAVGVAIGGFCLWLSIHNVDLHEAVRIFGAADPGGILVGVALFGAAMVVRAGRWQAILEFRAPIADGASLQALLAGYAVNSALPARIGELFRAHYLARRTGLSRSGVLASIFVERLLDLIVVVGILALGVALSDSGDTASRNILVGGFVADALGVSVLVLGATWCTRRRAGAPLSPLVNRPSAVMTLARRLGAVVADFAQLLRIVHTRRFLAASAATVPIWGLEIGAVWSICNAVGVNLTLPAVLSLMGGASLGTMLPTAPGYVGSYQFAYVVILAQFGVEATAAIVAATTVQIYLIGGFTLLGFATWGVMALIEGRRAATTETEGRP